MDRVIDSKVQLLPKEEFDTIYSRVPRLTVEVLVRTPDGIVLTKRDIEPCKGQWHLPGGTVLFGETLADTVRRVALEELNVEVAVGKQLGYIEYPISYEHGHNGRKGWPIGIVFEATILKGELKGSSQAEEVASFKKVPDNTFVEQAKYLKAIL